MIPGARPAGGHGCHQGEDGPGAHEPAVFSVPALGCHRPGLLGAAVESSDAHLAYHLAGTLPRASCTAPTLLKRLSTSTCWQSFSLVSSQMGDPEERTRNDKRARCSGYGRFELGATPGVSWERRRQSQVSSKP